MQQAQGSCRGFAFVFALFGLIALGAPAQAAAPEPDAKVPLLFFWGVGCPHCEEARPLVETLAKDEPRLRLQALEVRRDAEARRTFLETMQRLGATSVGVPTFVVGDAYVVGYTKGVTDEEVRALVRRALDAGPTRTPGRRVVSVPWLGEVDPASVSLPALTLVMGLADGMNPCAFWVLFVLLGILLHVENTRRMLLYAGTFVVMSGFVYFLFMVAWSTFFHLVGISRAVTMVLGAALLVMGLVNLKDVIWFKKGPSLMISDKVKPGLFRRMRAIAAAASTPAAFGGIAALAFIVNLVELGCTVGLPAVYTRMLSMRELSGLSRVAYIALYNVAYVVPLLMVVGVFIAIKRRLTMSERFARGLKGLSAVLLLIFGAIFLLAPDTLAAL
jgi:hypothetical protein